MKNVTAEEMTAVPMTMTVQEYIPMLLMNTAFEPGTCMEFIESLTDPDVKKMAYAEYYYFSGQHEKAVEYASPYLNHENAMIQMSACLIYSFANLSLNHICDQANEALMAFIGGASSSADRRTSEHGREHPFPSGRNAVLGMLRNGA